TLRIAGTGIGKRFGKGEIRFDIHYRRTIDQIQTAELQNHAVFMANNLFQLYQRHANWVRAESRACCENPHSGVTAEARWTHSRTPAAFHRLMKDEKDPYMAERFQAANGVGLVVGSNEMQFAVGAFYQTWLARNGELFFIGRANNAYLLELETAHFAVMLSAEPIHIA